MSGLGVEKLLGIPTILVGTGQLMGQKIFECIQEWSGVEENLAGLCFDTTASNTIVHTGAITIYQSFFFFWFNIESNSMILTDYCRSVTIVTNNQNDIFTRKIDQFHIYPQLLEGVRNSIKKINFQATLA